MHTEPIVASLLAKPTRMFVPAVINETASRHDTSWRLTHGDLRLHAFVSRDSCGLRMPVPFWPWSCKRYVRQRRWRA